MPIDHSSYPPSSPIQEPPNWRHRRAAVYQKTKKEPDEGGWIFRIGKGLFFLVIFLLAGLGASIVVTIASIGVLINKIDHFETMADDPLPNKIVLGLSLNEDPEEAAGSRHIFSLLDHNPGLHDIVSAIDAAANDRRVSSLALRLDSPRLSLASAQEVRDAVKRFRAAGKPAYVFSLSYGDLIGGTSDYYLASAFDNIWMQPTGVLGITGLRIEGPYFGGLLERLGVSYQVIAREEYKSAMENMTLRQMSPPARQMMESLMDNLFQQIIRDIASDRKLEPKKLANLIDNAPLTDAESMKSGLVDRLGYRDELLRTLEKNGEIVDISLYNRSIRAELSKKLEKSTAPQIALISGDGIILEGADGKNTPLGRGMAIEDIADALEAASTDPKIRAIILRLNTPGGSPNASEYLRRAIVQAQGSGKPVIVSMGAVTASGGYWIASAASKIVAQPATFTGSIGVISGKPTVKKLSDQYQVGWTSISRGANAELGSLSRPYTWQERAKMESMIDDSYQAFLERVAEGRKMDKAAVRTLAKGRVWSGDQALKNGLVDALGGVDVAVQVAKKTIGLDEKATVFLLPYPDHDQSLKTVFDFLDDLGVRVLTPAIIQGLSHILAPGILSGLSAYSGGKSAIMPTPSHLYF